MGDRFVCENINPKNKRSTDCVIRAISMAIGKTLEEVINDMVKIYFKTGWFISDTKCVDRYLKECGFIKHPQLKKESGRKYTGREFCTYLNEFMKSGNPVIAKIGTHHITVFVNKGTTIEKDYKVVDTWDCSTRCVGNWWSK